MNIAQVAPKNPRGRVSSDNVWPLRRADGKTWAEAQREKIMTKEIETKIAGQLVDDIIAAGYTITVNDGEEDTLIRSSHKPHIMEALQTTDEDYLKIMDDMKQIGTVWLIWGNGVDVISDYGGPDELMNGLMESANNIADKYS